MSKKAVLNVLGESVVIGLILLVLFLVVRFIVPSIPMIDNNLIVVFISGGLFHFLFEYLGYNKQYAMDYVAKYV
jgi:hypothetical protein